LRRLTRLRPRLPVLPFGKTDIGANNGWAPKFWAVACKYPLAEKGTVTSIVLYIGRYAHLPETYRLAIYSHDAVNNKPGSLLVETAEIEINQRRFWLTAEVSPTTLPPGDYWLAFKTKVGDTHWMADPGDVKQIAGKGFPSWSPFSDPFPIPESYLDYALSIYATYTLEIPPERACFVATAAYGSPLASELNVLRRFRDSCLPHTIVHAYYKIGPYLAKIIKNKEALKKFVREPLNVFVRLYRKVEKQCND